MEIPSKLSQALKILKLQSQKEHRPHFAEIRNTALFKATNTILNHQTTTSPKLRPDLSNKWTDARVTGKYPELTRSEIRSLCWIKDVALSTDFHRYLLSRQITLSRASMKGLVFSLTESWNDVIAGHVSLESARTTFSSLSTTSFLSEVEPFIFDSVGHEKFAKIFAREKKTLSQQYMSIFGISFSVNQFSQAVIDVVATKYYLTAVSDNSDDISWFYENVLSILDKKRLLLALDKIVQALDSSKNENAKDRLKDFVLSHPNLGDPRLPGFDSNWDQDSSLTKKVIEWLSQSDIKFFFELFIQNEEDKQGRKQFWLQFAHLVRGTRVVVSDTDRRRLYRNLTDNSTKYSKSRLLASLSDKQEPSTVFLMDFGILKVVEFSLSNNACYFYSNDGKFEYLDRARFWNTEIFSVRELKNQNICTERLSHQAGWEGKFQRTLALFGLRPRYF